MYITVTVPLGQLLKVISEHAVAGTNCCGGHKIS